MLSATRAMLNILIALVSEKVTAQGINAHVNWILQFVFYSFQLKQRMSAIRNYFALCTGISRGMRSRVFLPAAEAVFSGRDSLLIDIIIMTWRAVLYFFYFFHCFVRYFELLSH